GRLLVRFTHYKRIPLVGLLLSIAALVPLAIAPTGLSSWAALGLIALVGLGLGPTFPFTVVVVQNAVALHQLGVATGTMNFFRARRASYLLCARAHCLDRARAPYEAISTMRSDQTDSLPIRMTSPTQKPIESSEPVRHSPLSKAEIRNIFYGLMVGMFLSALNQTIVVTALPTIGREFGDFENLSW